eukprot:TRINITY_DN4563_c0_g1_i1.p1 TRINITY_DN4563_c0_g1~~TRINITY_DN4563_c0_g1_i1.p1  ORF type:complete len:1009 (+),score=374.62 TRINITY_DN4563_c0_g1_i1:46-3072(+)
MSVLVLIGLAALSAPEKELFSITCSGTVNLLGDLPYGIVADLSNQREVLTDMYGKVKERVKCHCPEITEQQFLDRFSPARVVFNLLGGRVEHEEELPCLDAQETYTRDLHKYLSAMFRGTEITLPETCTRADFVGEKGCRFEIDVKKDLSANLRFAFAECADSPFPSMGVWCAGESCSTLFQPCSGFCSEGQKCVEGVGALEGVLGDYFDKAAEAFAHLFGFNISAAADHLVRTVDGDIDSDRTLEDCEDAFQSFPNDLVTAFAKAVGESTSSGVCLPEDWQDISYVFEEYYGRWDKLSGMPRKDECGPLKPRTDSKFNWRRGQMTDNGLTGGGWCNGFHDCNFHHNAGDCESNDDFEYFMAKLYCKYKQKDGCLDYSPFCYWDDNESGKYRCKFNHTTQNDGITDPDGWKVGLDCANIDELAATCNAATNPLSACEHEYCACTGGTWDKEDQTCTPGTTKGKCTDMVQCWGAMQQCYEKSGENGPYMSSVGPCENFFQCRCREAAANFGCDPKLMCGRRCACMYSEKDRFVGPHCDIRLIRGNAPTLMTFEQDDPRGVPIMEWDGKLSSGSAANYLRTTPSPSYLAPPTGTATHPLLVTTCDGRVWVLPKTKAGFGIQIRGLDTLAESISTAALRSFRCAIEGVSDDDKEALKQMVTSYFVHSPVFWMARFFEGGSAFNQKGTLADYLFNMTGESEPAVPSLEELAREAQNEFPYPTRDSRGGSWVAEILTWINNGVAVSRNVVVSSLKELGWLERKPWTYPLIALQDMQNEQERAEKIRELLTQRQQEVVEMQKGNTGYKTETKVKAKAGGDKVGVRLALEGGEVEAYAAQCAANGLVEVQVGVGGKLAGALHMETACNKDEDCGEGFKCKGLDTLLFDTPIYSLDFMAGFVWGGNFSKGFIGGCPILSTTINQMDFSTAKEECIGQVKWANDLGTLFKKHTGNKVTPDKRITWCSVSKDDIVEQIFEKYHAGGVLDFTAAVPLTEAPYKVAKGRVKAAPRDQEEL